MATFVTYVTYTIYVVYGAYLFYAAYWRYHYIFKWCHVLFICWFIQHMLHICIISSGICAVQTALTHHLRVVLLFSIFLSCWTTQLIQSLSPLVCMQTKQRASGTPCVQPILSTDVYGKAVGQQLGKLLPHFPPLNSHNNSDVDKLMDLTVRV